MNYALNIDEAVVGAVRSATCRAEKVAIVCHMGPDGDALGSSLFMWHLLRAMGKSATVIVPDAYPANLDFMPGAREILVAGAHADAAARKLAAADVVFCLDFNELSRIDRMAPMLEASAAKRILVDHHTFPSEMAQVMLSRPDKSSTSMLVYMLAEACGWQEYITTEAASCCCVGMMTDTGGFSYNANDPDIYLVVAQLVALGVDKDALYKKVFDTTTERRLRIMGYCEYKKMCIFAEHHCAVITLSHDECLEFGYQKGDTESLVNRPLGIDHVVWSVYLRESEPGYVRVSMRSKGSFSVRQICAEQFGGGGHHNAAGGDFYGTIPEALSRLIEIMPLYAQNIEN